MAQTDNKIQQLRTFMLFQAIIFLIYGIQWFFLPELTLITIGGMETIPNQFWLMIIGSSFLAFGYFEYLTANSIENLRKRLDIVWGFALVPGLYLITLGLNFSFVFSFPVFFWLNTIVILLFLIGISVLRLRIR